MLKRHAETSVLTRYVQRTVAPYPDLSILPLAAETSVGWTVGPATNGGRKLGVDVAVGGWNVGEGTIVEVGGGGTGVRVGIGMVGIGMVGSGMVDVAVGTGVFVGGTGVFVGGMG